MSSGLSGLPCDVGELLDAGVLLQADAMALGW